MPTPQLDSTESPQQPQCERGIRPSRRRAAALVALAWAGYTAATFAWLESERIERGLFLCTQKLK